MVGQNAASRAKSITHEELLDAFLEHIPDHIYFKDPESRFVRISRVLAIHFGLADSAEAVNKTDFDMFTAEHAEQAFADEQEIIRTGRPVVAKEEKETWQTGARVGPLPPKFRCAIETATSSALSGFPGM